MTEETKKREWNRKNGTDHITLIFVKNGRDCLALLTSNIHFNICKYHNGKLVN